MARFNRTARILVLEGTDINRTYVPMTVIVPMDNIWDIKILESFEKEGIQYYEVYIYYTKLETERHMLITGDERNQVLSLIGGMRN